MDIAYFDCFAGAGGDMIVAALIDAGADADAVAAALAKLPLDGCSVRTETVTRGGIVGRRFLVEVAAGAPATHRNLDDIRRIMDAADLPDRAAANALEVFARLAAAEAKVHGTGVEEVHFHEVGAVDSIADIVGACLALELLGVRRTVGSSIALGRGTIQCAHGTLPAPAPATAELLTGLPTHPVDVDGEATTPTAAALLTTLVDEFGPMPAMEVAAVGYGAGARDCPELPNLFRVFVGRTGESETADTVVELSANIDDCTGEILGAAIDKLLSAGCLDAWATPIVMKKSRPAWQLSVLCRPADVAAAERIVFTETSTFGIRRVRATRTKLARDWTTVETPYGPIRVKVGRLDGRIASVAPEFADALAAAESHGAPIAEVIGSAMAGYRRQE